MKIKELIKGVIKTPDLSYLDQEFPGENPKKQAVITIKSIAGEALGTAYTLWNPTTYELDPCKAILKEGRVYLDGHEIWVEGKGVREGVIYFFDRKNIKGQIYHCSNGHECNISEASVRF